MKRYYTLMFLLLLAACRAKPIKTFGSRLAKPSLCVELSEVNRAIELKNFEEISVQEFTSKFLQYSLSVEAEDDYALALETDSFYYFIQRGTKRRGKKSCNFLDRIRTDSLETGFGLYKTFDRTKFGRDIDDYIQQKITSSEWSNINCKSERVGLSHFAWSSTFSLSQNRLINVKSSISYNCDGKERIENIQYNYNIEQQRIE